MAFHHSPHVVTDGLALYLDAANPKSYPGSGTTWYDLSGNDNTATLSTPTYVTEVNGSLLFDANGDNVQTSEYAIPATGAFTLEFLYKITGIAGRGGVFERNSASPYKGISLGQGGPNVWAFTISDSFYGGNSLQADYTYPSVGVWYHDTAVFNGTNQVLAYRNGVLVDSTTGNTVGNLDTGGNRDKMLLMKRDAPSSTLLGSSAGVRVYNRALTASEVKQNFDATRRRFGL